jgi:lysophospholipid acyltransferase (LPLAT)-like uncharacterized protein
MAIARAGNMISASADADTISGPVRVCGIKVVAGAGGITVNLRKGSVGGTIMYTSTLAANAQVFEELELQVPAAGIYVQISAGAGVVYLYA